MFPKQRNIDSGSNTYDASRLTKPTHGKHVKPTLQQRVPPYQQSYHQKQYSEPLIDYTAPKYPDMQQNIPRQQSFGGGNYTNNYSARQYPIPNSDSGYPPTWSHPSMVSRTLDYAPDPPQRYHMNYVDQLAANLREFNMADQTAWRPM